MSSLVRIWIGCETAAAISGTSRCTISETSRASFALVNPFRHAARGLSVM